MLLLAGPLTALAQDPRPDSQIRFQLDATPVSAPAVLPLETDLNIETEQISTSEKKEKDLLEGLNKETAQIKEQMEYEQTLAVIEQKRAEEARKAQISEQGKAFSRSFLAMNLYAADFPEKFQKLLQDYPLAAEDPFCARLIERGNRLLPNDKPSNPEVTSASAE